MRVPLCLSASLIAASSIAATTARSAEIEVGSNGELSRAAAAAKPGDTILLRGGPYSGVHLVGLRGTEANPIIITGASAKAPALFRGGKTGLHLSRSEFVTLRYLDVAGSSINGINIDDGGDKARPARGILVEGCTISDIGSRGNHDGLKMSGVDAFSVRGCRFDGWGGSGIDMVGCHDGQVVRCEFSGKDGLSQSNGVQMKGGSARVAVLRCTFRNAGQRAINIGGSTGLDYFRPEVGDFEAKAIEVAGNRFIGSMAPIAWVNCSGGHVHHNTIFKPEKWVARILQQSTGEGFKPAHGGVFEHNLIVFDRQVSSFVNVGGGTDPESFTFRNNAWFESGGRGRKPTLPTRETGGVYGSDPELSGVEDGLRITSTDPALRDKGADAYREAGLPRRAAE